IDVAEERDEMLVDLGVDTALEGVEGAEEGVNGPIEVRGLPAQLVDALGGCGRATKDRSLDLFHVIFEAGDHRGVIIDDLVQDRPQAGGRSYFEELRTVFEAPPGAAELAGHPVPNRDQEAT